MKLLALAGLLLLGSCAAPAPPDGFSSAGPSFDPLAFFNGHVTSWGVEENRGGRPIAIVTTDCEGTATSPGGIRMVQILHVGHAPPQTRIWQFQQTGPDRFSAAANDMSGTATGIVTGRMFHWTWILETRPGNMLGNVKMDQWMYKMDDGSVMIRTIVSKLGFRLVEISEQFEAHVPK